MWSDNKVVYTTIVDVRCFEFWAGAKVKMDNATDEQLEKVYDRIMCYCESFNYCKGDYPSDTDINDLVWFECDDIFFPDEYEDE